jgi:hypothetical protein
MAVSPLNNRGGFNRRTMLPPEKGAENLKIIGDGVKQWRLKMKQILQNKEQECFKPRDPRYMEVRKATLSMMSMVLSKSPLKGADGPRGLRTYDADPMFFSHGDEYLLRELGRYFAPSKYSPANVLKIVNRRFARYEMYKFIVRVPSDLVGINIDYNETDCRRLVMNSFEKLGTKDRTIKFQCFDGGKVFDPNGGQLKLFAEVKLSLVTNRILIDLRSVSYETIHDVDAF